MDIFAVFSLIGGLAFFLFGMHVMSNNLEKMAGGKLELLLKKMTTNPFVSLFWARPSPLQFSPRPPRR